MFLYNFGRHSGKIKGGGCVKENILDTVVTIPCHPRNKGGRRRADQIKYLVYHYTANDGDRSANNGRYFRDNVVRASAHYFVDDDAVTRSVEDLEVAWAVADKKWSDCAVTGGGKLYGVVTNTNSLSIEMCDTRRDGTLMATEATMARAARLGRALMEKYHIPIERVIRHFDVSGKHCPAYFMDEKKWAAFKERLIETREEDMTGKEIYEKLAEYLAGQSLPRWAEEEYRAAIDAGITDGTDPMILVPRYQAALMALRARKREEEA